MKHYARFYLPWNVGIPSTVQTECKVKIFLDIDSCYEIIY